MFLSAPAHTGLNPVPLLVGFLRHKGVRRLFMAIQDYVRSIAATETVSKAQVFRFLEMQFARADRNHDGELDEDELAQFISAISRPESDLR
jgi:hypothetical protein